MRLKVYIDNNNNTISHFEIINSINVIINYKIFNDLIHKEIYSTQYISNTDLKKVIHCMDLVELKEIILVKDNKIEYIKMPITKNKFILYKIEKDAQRRDERGKSNFFDASFSTFRMGSPDSGVGFLSRRAGILI